MTGGVPNRELIVVTMQIGRTRHAATKMSAWKENDESEQLLSLMDVRNLIAGNHLIALTKTDDSIYLVDLWENPEVNAVNEKET
jgi:hypothetical protein